MRLRLLHNSTSYLVHLHAPTLSSCREATAVGAYNTSTSTLSVPFSPRYTQPKSETDPIELLQIVTMADNKAVPNGTADASISENPHDAKATEILRIIEKYGLNFERTGSWDGFATFLPIVKRQVEREESVKMLLPGFPFKSPNNKTKVLGILPDLGEELALKRLDGIASAIDAAYEHGAEIHITSDGLVYNGSSNLS